MVRPLRILVAEDSMSSWFVIKRMLEVLGHQGERASTGLETVARALQEEFDLVLLDYHMPEIDGDEAARRIEAGKPELPLVGMSASDPTGGLDVWRLAGLQDVLAKPIRLEELKQILEQRCSAERKGGS